MSETPAPPSPAPEATGVSPRRRVKNALVLLTAIYTLGMVLFLLIRLLFGEGWPLVAMINNVVHLLLMPAFVLLPLMVYWQRWWLAVLLVPPIAVFIASYGVFFSSRSAAAPPDAPQITLLTYNLHGEWIDVEPMIELIRQVDADVVALQEVSELAEAQFEEALADLYPYQALHSHTLVNAGQGVLSRYPVLADDYWRNEEQQFIERGHQRVELDVDGTVLTLYNTHPPNPLLYGNPFAIVTGSGYDVELHHESITDILDRTGQDVGPLVITGAFNMTDQSAGYQRLAGRYTDVYREIGWGMGFTYPDWSDVYSAPDVLGPVAVLVPPLLRLDFIFHDEAVLGLEAQVWPGSGTSDHRPVWARLALVGG